MRYTIKVYNITNDHILTIPTYTHTIYVTAKNQVNLENYIAQELSDDWGNHYSPTTNWPGQITHKSNSGALLVEEYHEPKINFIKVEDYLGD